MSAHGDLPEEELLRRLHNLALETRHQYGLPDGTEFALINHSENTTYRVDTPDDGPRYALRVHREAYHTDRAIECELEWMSALRAEAGVPTAAPIAGMDGHLIHTIHQDDLPNPRKVVLFEWMEGEEPDEEGDLLGPFEVLGEVAGRMHTHARQYRPRQPFERHQWDWETSFGPNKPLWGHWQDEPHLNAEGKAILERLSARLKERLDLFGMDASRFGLAHADLRLANLLLYQGDTRVIDFDDCGVTWFLYDVATALSFMEQREDVSELVASWVKGYRKVIDLSPQEEAEIPTFLMMRRLLIVAWMGSHSETDLARDLGPDYIATSYELAERYLSGWSLD